MSNAPRTPALTAFLVEALAEEHVQFRRTLSLFARYAQQVVSGDAYDPRLARDFLRILRTSVEQGHRDREERILFPWLEANGIPHGPLVVLRAEHDLGRDLMKRLELAVRALMASPGAGAACVHFHGLALYYVEHFTAHADKEEHALFPLAREIATRNGSELRCLIRSPGREATWIDALEAGAAGSWPQPALALHRLDSLQGFERLCRGSASGRKRTGATGPRRSPAPNGRGPGRPNDLRRK